MFRIGYFVFIHVKSDKGNFQTVEVSGCYIWVFAMDLVMSKDMFRRTD